MTNHEYAFDYEPLTEEEVQKAKEYPLLNDGIYDFEVVESKPTYSKNGNPMISVQLLIYDQSGRGFTVYDYLIALENMMWKTKHFCDSVGLVQEYKDKKFSHLLCLDRHGKVEIRRKKGELKNDGSGEFYKDKNVVVDYVMTDKGATMYEGKIDSLPIFNQSMISSPHVNSNDKLDADIPF